MMDLHFIPMNYILSRVALAQLEFDFGGYIGKDVVSPL